MAGTTTSVPQMDMFSATMIADGEWDMSGFEPNEENFTMAYQFLIDTGAAWRLQGRIGRTAMDMISQGLCHRAGGLRMSQSPKKSS